MTTTTAKPYSQDTRENRVERLSADMSITKASGIVKTIYSAGKILKEKDIIE